MSGALRVALAALALLAGACARPAPPPPAAPPPPRPIPAARPAETKPSETLPRSFFVLLPDPDGTVGRLSVTTPSGVELLSQPNQVSGVGAAGEAPRAPITIEATEVQRIFGAVIAAQPRQPVHFLLYFKLGTDELTPESAARLPDVVRTVQERQPADVSVIGHTDTTGERRANYQLGLRRAEAIAAALRSLGLDPGRVEIRSHGQEDPLVRTGPNVDEPRNRRVEVTVR